MGVSNNPIFYGPWLAYSDNAFRQVSTPPGAPPSPNYTDDYLRACWPHPWMCAEVLMPTTFLDDCRPDGCRVPNCWCIPGISAYDKPWGGLYWEVVPRLRLRLIITAKDPGPLICAYNVRCDYNKLYLRTRKESRLAATWPKPINIYHPLLAALEQFLEAYHLEDCWLHLEYLILDKDDRD